MLQIQGLGRGYFLGKVEKNQYQKCEMLRVYLLQDVIGIPKQSLIHVQAVNELNVIIRKFDILRL